MPRRPAPLLALSLAAIVCAQLLGQRASSAERCPAMKGAAHVLGVVEAEQRYRYIARVLAHQKKQSRYWNVTWTALAAGATGGHLFLANWDRIDDADFKASQNVSAIKAGLGVITFSLLPLRIPELDEAGLPAGACARLAVAEGLLQTAARRERIRRLLDHASTVLVNVAAFLYLYIKRDDLTGGLLNAGFGVVAGEVKAFTSPMGAVNALRAYKLGNIASGLAERPRWRVVATPMPSGGVLSLLGSF